MSDRRKLQDELNRINNLYQEYDLQLSKSGATMQQRQQLRDMMNAKKDALISEMGDDLQKLNRGAGINVGGGTISKIKDVAGEGFDAAKKADIIKMVGKKAMGMIPVGGVIAGAVSGDPAMAAEELGRDAIEAAPAALATAAKIGAGTTPVGLGMIAADAFMPEQAGNSEEERMMLAEDKARKAYAQSPGRMAKLKKMLGK
jgi:hypothetical protein